MVLSHAATPDRGKCCGPGGKKEMSQVRSVIPSTTDHQMRIPAPFQSCHHFSGPYGYWILSMIAVKFTNHCR